MSGTNVERKQVIQKQGITLVNDRLRTVGDSGAGTSLHILSRSGLSIRSRRPCCPSSYRCPILATSCGDMAAPSNHRERNQWQTKIQKDDCRK